jgi:hypothetical protein
MPLELSDLRWAPKPRLCTRRTELVCGPQAQEPQGNLSAPAALGRQAPSNILCRGNHKPIPVQVGHTLGTDTESIPGEIDGSFLYYMLGILSPAKWLCPIAG